MSFGYRLLLVAVLPAVLFGCKDTVLVVATPTAEDARAYYSSPEFQATVLHHCFYEAPDFADPSQTRVWDFYLNSAGKGGECDGYEALMASWDAIACYSREVAGSDEAYVSGRERINIDADGTLAYTHRSLECEQDSALCEEVEVTEYGRCARGAAHQ